MTQEKPKPLPLGTKTEWGKINAIAWTGGERYYFMSKGRSVAMIPAFMVEPQIEMPEEFTKVLEDNFWDLLC